MREIKFRAWNDIEKRMVSVSDLTLAEDRPGWWSINGESDHILTELMQYTGIKDKNGVEVYEGDIVQNEHTKNNHVVEYVADTGIVGSCGDCYESFSGAGFIWNRGDTGGDVEVIGNIYENRELLKAV